MGRHRVNGALAGLDGPDRQPDRDQCATDGPDAGVADPDCDGDVAIQAPIVGLVDDAHPAAAKLRDDLIRPEGGAWSQGHRVTHSSSRSPPEAW